jgi:hypothetical protein
LPLALFLLFTGFYLLTMSGHTYSADEETMYAVTRGLALAGDIAALVTDGAPIAALRPGADGRGYSPYGVLPSLLALPFFGLGALAAPLGPAAFNYATRFAITAMNAPITAATAALLAAWALRLGASRRGAIGLALLYGVCTFAWVYARTFFSEPLAALLLLLAAERADAARNSGWGQRYLLISGLAAGLLVTTRIASAVALPVIALYLLAGQRASGEHRPLEDNQLLGLAGAWRRALVWWGLGLLPGLTLVAAYNFARFGTALATGYASESGLFTTPLQIGLFGLLLSPGKSILLYAPPIVLALPGAIQFWKQQRDLVLLVAGLALAHMLLYGSWGEWAGGGVWGPRFLLPIVPLLLIMATSLFRRSPYDQEGRNAVAHLFKDGQNIWTKVRFGSLRSAVSPLPLTPSPAPLDPPHAEVMGEGEPAKSGDDPSRSKHGCCPPLNAHLGFIASSSAAVILGLLGFAGNLGGVLVNFNTYLNMPVAADRIYAVDDSPLLAHWRIFADRLGRYTFPGPHCALGDGFFSPEGSEEETLPRRSGTRGELHCTLTNTALLALNVDDRRPPTAPSSDLTLTLDGSSLGAQPTGQARSYQMLLPPGRTTLLVVAQTWNPRQVGFSDRDDELGVLIKTVQLTPPGTDPLPLVDRAIAPLPERPRPRWAWYYDPPNQHLVDHWAWYLPRSELPSGAMYTLALMLLGSAELCLAVGLALLRRSRAV